MSKRKEALNRDQARRFRRVVKTHYKKYGRHDLPWRKTNDPYRIVVSELMLQQTQVSRVIDKYHTFIKRFPTVRSLARASLSEVLSLWSGLGYNRRAKFLYRLALSVTKEHKGVFPHTEAELRTLPGIGPYTARAVAAFAFNKPSVLIETNVRTVFIHYFFEEKSRISDAMLFPYIEATLDKKDPKTWYWALMDYGSFLKAKGNRAHRHSSHYKKQSSFVGSRRQLRGAIVRFLIEKDATASVLAKMAHKKEEELSLVLSSLTQEEIIVKKGRKYTLAPGR